MMKGEVTWIQGGIVDEALNYYMVGHPAAFSVYGFFDGYAANHQQWLTDQERV